MSGTTGNAVTADAGLGLETQRSFQASGFRFSKMQSYTVGLCVGGSLIRLVDQYVSSPGAIHRQFSRTADSRQRQVVRPKSRRVRRSRDPYNSPKYRIVQCALIPVELRLTAAHVPSHPSMGLGHKQSTESVYIAAANAATAFPS
jgi:hypothetical protein